MRATYPNDQTAVENSAMTSLTVGSYNLLNGGVDDGDDTRLHRQLALLRSLQLDVLAAQEARWWDRPHRRSRSPRVGRQTRWRDRGRRTMTHHSTASTRCTRGGSWIVAPPKPSKKPASSTSAPTWVTPPQPCAIRPDSCQVR